MKYSTRENVHVDRCASAWLIKRFIDSEAEFVFVTGHSPAPNTISFDMHGADWGHRNNRCTFETICDIHKIDDPAILEIARIIHGADISSDSDETLESPGIDLLFAGVRLASPGDDEAIKLGYSIMDALYEAIKARNSA